MRQRQRLVSDAARQVHHMQKVLLQMNLQLPQVVSDITGQTGLRIIEAILGGERDPHVLARLRNERCKADAATIAKALEGTWRKEHLLSLRQAHALWALYQKLREEAEAALCEIIEARFADEDFPESDPPSSQEKTQKRKTDDFSEPVRKVWERKAGVDLMQIEGVSARTASIILSEVGMDIGRFQSAKQLAAWAGCAQTMKSPEERSFVIGPEEEIAWGRLCACRIGAQEQQGAPDRPEPSPRFVDPVPRSSALRDID